ncbi:hypothetical protein SVAN01_08498 [Stagonosporopsis vannaccii]|nr:hypothetical protein SVAN01_08498 [Stagonosporopsis vannaccii]
MAGPGERSRARAGEGRQLGRSERWACGRGRGRAGRGVVWWAGRACCFLVFGVVSTERPRGTITLQQTAGAVSAKQGPRRDWRRERDTQQASRSAGCSSDALRRRYPVGTPHACAQRCQWCRGCQRCRWCQCLRAATSHLLLARSLWLEIARCTGRALALALQAPASPRMAPGAHSCRFSAALAQHGGEALEVQPARHAARQVDPVTLQPWSAAAARLESFALPFVALRARLAGSPGSPRPSRTGAVLAVSLLRASSAALDEISEPAARARPPSACTATRDKPPQWALDHVERAEYVERAERAERAASSGEIGPGLRHLTLTVSRARPALTSPCHCSTLLSSSTITTTAATEQTTCSAVSGSPVHVVAERSSVLAGRRNNRSLAPRSGDIKRHTASLCL